MSSVKRKPASSSKRGENGDVPRFVPWSSWEEWSWVQRNLLSESDVERHLGARRVLTVWRLRGSVPHAAECTALLVSARDGASRSNDAKRLELAMAVTRTVNGLVDPGQKGKRAVSISRLASTLKLPSWLVDVRHSATHNALPSLELLAAASSDLLAYLRTEYWDAQADLLASYSALSKSALSSFGETARRYEKEDLKKTRKKRRKLPAAVGTALGSLATVTCANVLLDVLVHAQGGSSAIVPAGGGPKKRKRQTAEDEKQEDFEQASAARRLKLRARPLFDWLRRRWPGVDQAVLRGVLKRLSTETDEKTRRFLGLWAQDRVAEVDEREKNEIWDAASASSSIALTLAESLQPKKKRAASLEDMEAHVASLLPEEPEKLWRARTVAASQPVGAVISGDYC